MELEKFVDLVRRMRKAQLDYYRDRTYGKLVAAKDLERQCDSALRNGVEADTSAQPTVVQTSFMEVDNGNAKENNS